MLIIITNLMIISDLYYIAGRLPGTVILILSFALEGCERGNNYPEVYKYEIPDLLVLYPGKAVMTNRDVHMMSSGLQRDDESTSYYNHANDMHKLFTTAYPKRFILSKDLLWTPGTRFDCENCNISLIEAIVHWTTVTRLDSFCDSVLFSKPGIEKYEWQKDYTFNKKEYHSYLLPVGAVS